MTVASLMMETNAAPARVRVMLLDGFCIQVDGRAVPLRTAEQRVVALIAIRGRPTSRPQVAGTLWTDMSDERSMANLRSTLWRLRRCGVRVIESIGDSLQLGIHVSVDLRDRLDAAERALAGTALTGDDSVDGLRFAGELLPEWSDDWVLVERERFRQLRLHALEQACERYAAVGQFGRAVDAGLAAVASEPLRESAHRSLIRVHLAEGNAVEALRQYRTYEQLMRDELGLRPSSTMRLLLAELA